MGHEPSGDGPGTGHDIVIVGAPLLVIQHIEAAEGKIELPSRRFAGQTHPCQQFRGLGHAHIDAAHADEGFRAAGIAQGTFYIYFDGKEDVFRELVTEMGRFTEINRTIIPNDEIPENVKDAVVASEDSSFYENRGVSPRGIVRALINNLRGGAQQGGSTITQQYVERYHTGTTTSYVGKARKR